MIIWRQHLVLVRWFPKQSLAIGVLTVLDLVPWSSRIWSRGGCRGAAGGHCPSSRCQPTMQSSQIRQTAKALDKQAESASFWIIYRFYGFSDHSSFWSPIVSWWEIWRSEYRQNSWFFGGRLFRQVPKFIDIEILTILSILTVSRIDIVKKSGNVVLPGKKAPAARL